MPGPERCAGGEGGPALPSSPPTSYIPRSVGSPSFSTVISMLLRAAVFPAVLAFICPAATAQSLSLLDPARTRLISEEISGTRPTPTFAS